MTFDEIKSPCINVCKLDPSQSLCIGCYRTRGEIGEWSRASDARKLEIVEVSEIRAAQRKSA